MATSSEAAKFASPEDALQSFEWLLSRAGLRKKTTPFATREGLLQIARRTLGVEPLRQFEDFLDHIPITKWDGHNFAHNVKAQQRLADGLSLLAQSLGIGSKFPLEAGLLLRLDEALGITAHSIPVEAASIRRDHLSRMAWALKRLSNQPFKPKDALTQAFRIAIYRLLDEEQRERLRTVTRFLPRILLFDGASLDEITFGEDEWVPLTKSVLRFTQWWCALMSIVDPQLASENPLDAQVLERSIWILEQRGRLTPADNLPEALRPVSGFSRDGRALDPSRSSPVQFRSIADCAQMADWVFGRGEIRNESLAFSHRKAWTHIFEQIVGADSPAIKALRAVRFTASDGLTLRQPGLAQKRLAFGFALLSQELNVPVGETLDVKLLPILDVALRARRLEIRNSGETLSSSRLVERESIVLIYEHLARLSGRAFLRQDGDFSNLFFRVAERILEPAERRRFDASVVKIPAGLATDGREVGRLIRSRRVFLKADDALLRFFEWWAALALSVRPDLDGSDLFSRDTIETLVSSMRSRVLSDQRRSP